VEDKQLVTIGDALSYTESDWLKYGDNPNPNTREKMIMLAIEQIIQVGPADFISTQVCDRLDIKRPMINHYFGSRDRFIAEINWWAYQEWAKHVDRSFRNAPANPTKRLRAFILGEIQFAQRMGGMNILLHYPLASSAATKILSEEHQEDMQKIFEYHLALLTITVKDINTGKVSELNFDAENVPKKSLLLQTKYFLAATQISWATHGLASWSSGKHIATHQIENKALSSLTSDFAVGKMVDKIVSMAKIDKS
jgi:AcrR family transcriptional regulator